MQYEPRHRPRINACQVKDLDRDGEVWKACVKVVRGSYRVRTSRGLQYMTEYDWVIVNEHGDVSCESSDVFPSQWKAITPQVGDIWRHLARGSEYRIVAIAQAQSKGEDGKIKVVYADTESGVTHERVWDEFLDGRFERIAP